MERAIVSLRDRRLPEAYDPPQVEALAALEQAKKIVDEQKAKVDEQIADKEKEAIRQKYVRIKDEQEKLNDETTRIENVAQPDGDARSVPDAVRLGQLPGEQGKLADGRTKSAKISRPSARPSTSGQTRTSSTSMNDVKADLAKPSNGRADAGRADCASSSSLMR